MENTLKDLFKEVESQKPAIPTIPKLKDRLTEELVIAFVGPVGSGCSTSAEILRSLLKDDYDYDISYYKLSRFIELGDTNISDLPAAERIKLLQKKGDDLRERYGENYLAAKVIEEIALFRDKNGVSYTAEGVKVTNKIRHVHIIDSIKHPEELELLRSTYGEILWMMGIFAPYDIRLERLKNEGQILHSEINGIIKNDYREDVEHGQRVSDVFHKSDFFIRNDLDNTAQLKISLERFLEVLFGSPVHTPTLDESSMYSAYAEAARSACLSRAVGASIVSMHGELIGLGRNDVPKFRGGLYIEDDAIGHKDHRCHAWRDKTCHNDKKKNLLYIQIYDKLKEDGLLSDVATQEKVEKQLKNTDVKSLIEYSRAVHAEMDAITSIARMSKVGILGGTLYSTTFPCHSCARHIVASGITKVFFIEPYPKSLATELHSDAVSENEGDEGKKVLFLQYTGIAPKNILKLFRSGVSRKDKQGKVVKFNKKKASPIVKVSIDDYTSHEKMVIAELVENEKEDNNG